MHWKKKGLIFSPVGQYPWLRSHASLPVTLLLGNDIYRVYFASRDERNRSHVGYVDFDVHALRVVSLSSNPVLAPGPLGHFDDHGVYAASLVQHEGRVFMYYIGWNPGQAPPLFYSAIGLAVSEDGGDTFAKLSSVPIMSRSVHDPCLVTSPCVLLDQGKWRMWYVSGNKWEERGETRLSFYDIKYAESTDGIEWRRDGLVAVGLCPGERNLARPSILKDGNRYRMWFSSNAGEGYRLRYAESEDGYAWTRRDDGADLGVSESGWDCEAVCYPWVFEHAGRVYMLYNGNAFGKEGFGLAVSDS